MTTAPKHEITDSRVCFPLTAGGGLAHIWVEPLSETIFHNLSEGFLSGGNNPAPARKQFSNRLKRLAGASRPAKLLLDGQQQPNWRGDSYQLAAAIAWLRVQNEMDLKNAPRVCASALVGENGEVVPLNEGEPNALREKLQLLLNMKCNERPAFFCYAKAQQLSEEERQQLDQLKEEGMKVLPLDHLKELPPELIGVPANTSKHHWSWWLLASLALLGLAPLIEDWVSEHGFLPRDTHTIVAPAPLKAPELTVTFHPDGAPQGAVRFLRGGERLPAGRLHLSARIRRPGYYYAFLVQRPTAGGQGLVAELFRRAGLERYLRPGRVEIPPHGLHLDGTPARLELLLIARSQADPELQALIESLPEGLSHDPARIQALDRYLLTLPANAVARFTFSQ